MEEPKQSEEYVHTKERPGLRYPKHKAEDWGGGVGAGASKQDNWAEEWAGMCYWSLSRVKGARLVWIFQENRINRGERERERERKREIYYMITEAEKSRIYSQ